MKILALCNPASGGKPERLAALEKLAAGTTSQALSVVATEDAQAAERALAQHRLGADDVLLLSGGDGTIQHALSWLLHHDSTQSAQDPQELPAIAVLPAGSTNMSAFDINAQKGWQSCLDSFMQQLAAVESATLVDRRLVTVTDGMRRHAGFFVGAGAIVRGIEYCNDVLWVRGAARKERTAGLAMARTIWGVLRQQPPFDELESMSVQDRLRDGVQEAALSPASGALLFAASSLDRLIMGARPFWGVPEQERLRYVLVERDARLLRNLPGLFGVPGFARPIAESGFHSHNCTHVSLHLNSAYAIDGELFKPQDGVLELDVDRSLRFFVL